MDKRLPVIVIASGGHAKVVVSTLLYAGEVVCYALDDREERWGATLLGVPIIGPIAKVTDYVRFRAIIGIGNNAIRKKVQEELHAPWTSTIHPKAFVDPSVTIGVGSVVFAGAIIQPGARIGNHVVINTAATIDHDCVIDDYAQVAPGVHIGGAVHIEEGAFIGIGASVAQCLRIGKWSTIGAGSAIIRDVPDRATVVGVPGRTIKMKTNEVTEM